MKNVQIVCVGIGGYGEVLLSELLQNGASHGVCVSAAVEPFPEHCKLTPVLAQKGIPLFSSLDEFYSKGNKADIALIVTPIAFHTEHIIKALENGSNAVCEKPLCADKNDIDRLIKARDKSGKFVYIGYQWSHSEAIEAVKKDCMSGLFGKPIRLKTLVLWPRDADYFSRGTGWAGKIRTADGALIYDSIANNAAAHYLHNMFYLLGNEINTCLEPVSFTAKLQRANKIENFDTADIICNFENGATARFIASHAIRKNLNPVFDYKFEKCTLLYSQDEPSSDIEDSSLYKKDCIKAIFADGTVKEYGTPFDGVCRKVYIAADRVRNEPDGYERCGIETAAVHTRFINKLQENAVISDFPAERLVTDGKLTYVDGLYEELVSEYNKD